MYIRHFNVYSAQSIFYQSLDFLEPYNKTAAIALERAIPIAAIVPSSVLLHINQHVRVVYL